jgi:hypothetical protein
VTRNKRILLSLVLAFWAAALYAGDEDMSPSAYHVFDPETGFMMTVDPTDEEQLDAAPPDVDAPEIEPTAPVDWRGWIAALLIVGGIVIWLRKKRASRR